MEQHERFPERVTAMYTLIGPSTGANGVPSTSFTVALTSAGSAAIGTGTLAVTPNDGGGGGTFFPVTVNLTAASPSATFNYTPASTGVKTISTANNGGLINPRSLPYTAT